MENTHSNAYSIKSLSKTILDKLLRKDPDNVKTSEKEPNMINRNLVEIMDDTNKDINNMLNQTGEILESILIMIE